MLKGPILPISEAAHTIANFESFSALPYLDTANVPTIGYGTTRYPNGTRVTMKDRPITEETAMVYLMSDLGHTARFLWNICLERVPSQHQWAAILSITYNEGESAISRSHLLSEFNDGNDAAAADQFLVWKYEHLNGKLVEVPGLLHRRIAERQIFLS